MVTTLPRSSPQAPATRAPLAVRATRAAARPEFRWVVAALVSFLLALPLQLFGAPAWVWGPLFAVTYVTGGWEPGWAGLCALRERTLDVDLLMVVAAVGAAAVGQALDGALLIVIFATSGALEEVATARTAASVRGLLDLAPSTATLLDDDGGERTVPSADLRVGQMILVRPGERIGADGLVTDGASEVDQATITGEPLPVAKQTGDEVFAGTLNGTGALRVQVQRDPKDSVIARIVTMVEEASATKAPTQLLVEKVEQRYSLGMVASTVALFVVPLSLGAELRPTLLQAMTFMIVASPCAVVLATMPPLLSAIANAGRHGVLVKSAVVMEQLGRIDTVAMDKTGTLTVGTPRVAEICPLPGTSFDEDRLLAYAAAAEHASEHPLATAVLAAARTRGLLVPVATDFRSTPGRGVSATVEGRNVEVGNPTNLIRDDRHHPAATLAQELQLSGRTAVLVSIDATPAGVLGIADQVRPDAATTVRALTALTGRGPLLVTGDNSGAATRLGEEVGITDIHAGLLPQGKVEIVQQLQGAGGRVLLVGDGVNDAPALAAAHAGIAMGRAGSDLALETADAVIVRDELSAIPAVIALSRRARRLVLANLAIAAAFILVLVAWDLTATLPLPLGVAGHEGSTVIVGLNGLRLLRDAAWPRPTPAPA